MIFHRVQTHPLLQGGHQSYRNDQMTQADTYQMIQAETQYYFD